MKSCPDYASSTWPYIMVAFISGVVTFVTWLTLSLADVGRLEQIAATAFVFIAVGGTLLHYVIGCVRRHRKEAGGARPSAPPRATPHKLSVLAERG